jgi:hypothetical protein
MGDWVVKTPSMYGGRTIPLLREAIAADLLALGGLPPPPWGILRLPETFVSTDATEAGRRAASVFGADAGKLAFCSAYVPAPVVNRAVFVHKGRMKASILADAIKLYALDRFFWHGDRTKPNPNCLRLHGRLVPVDHDCFFFTLDHVDETGCGPDLQGDPLSSTADGHVAYDLVRKHLTHCSWDEVAAALGHLADDNARGAIFDRWPKEWDRMFGEATSAGYLDEVDRFLRRRIPLVVRILNAVKQ